MPPRLLRLVPWVILALFIAAFLALLNWQYPLLGQDYFHFFPRILSAQWHFENAGLWPYRYDPHLCGGLVRYGNPESSSYSILQLLSGRMDLWNATMTMYAVLLAAGYAGWYRVGRDMLRLSRGWSHALALIVSASGYYLLHMIVGHLVFRTTPLLGWLLWLAFSDRRAMPLYVRAAVFALLCFYMLHAGGYFVLMQAAVFLPLAIPFDLAFSPGGLAKRTKELGIRLSAIAIATLLLCASKLTAIYAYMRFFPRFAPFNPYVGDDPLLLYIAKSFWMIPQSRFAFETQPYNFAPHEYSMHISPVTLIGLLGTGWIAWRARRSLGRARWIILGTGIALLTVLTLGFARGEGPVAEAMQALPILASWRMNMRFLYVTSLFVAMAGVAGAAFLSDRLFGKARSEFAAIAASAVTVGAFWVAHVSLISPEYLDLQMPYPQVREAIAQSGFLNKRVTIVEDYRGKQVSDFQYILAGTTGTTCYETTIAGKAHILPKLTPGPVDRVVDGAFMINNPACMQYPEANNCEPGDRILETDRDNFERFVSGKQPRWKLPWWQRLADVSTIVMLLLCFCITGRQALRRITSNSPPPPPAPGASSDDGRTPPGAPAENDRDPIP